MNAMPLLLQRRTLFATAGLALFLSSASVAVAGMNGQPPAPAKLADTIQPLARRIANGSDIGGGRTGLIQVVETNATADFTDLLAPALADGGTYTAIAATLEDARDDASNEEQRRFIRYNLARIHVLRARTLTGSAKNGPLAAAEAVVRGFEAEKLRDAALWELAGDVYSERGDVASAETAYRRMTASGGSAALSQFKLAQAYQRARRYDDARRAYEAGIRADASSGSPLRSTYHRLYQGLATLYLAQGNDPAAGEALLFSARAQPDSTEPYRFRTDVARALLRRGRVQPVRAYAEAALKSMPEDEDLKQLLADARAARGR